MTATKLNTKQRAIIPIAAFTASGNLDKLKVSLEEGLDAGLTVNEIKEILVQLYAYAGFPRSLNGLGTFMAVMESRKDKGIKDETGKEATPLPTDKSSLEFGTENQTRLVGQPVSGALFDFAPAIDQYLKAHLFGDIFRRDVLDWSERELATIAALANIKGVNSQLQAHFAAQTMAERGFIAMAFDESYNGESSGEPRHLSSPDIFVEDFSAGVDFLGTRSFVDKNKIGVIGLCGSGAFALTAAQVDHRIKAVATASMYDMSRVIRKGWKDTMADAQRNKTLDQLGEQRWKDFENGTPLLPQGFPEKALDSIPEGLDPISSEFWEYYAMPRGHHPRSHGPFTRTSNMAFMNFALLNYIDTISPRPILFIMGQKAHSRYFTEDAYKLAAEPKELVIVPGARHIDLYDRTDMIPFDKLTTFFNKTL